MNPYSQRDVSYCCQRCQKRGNRNRKLSAASIALLAILGAVLFVWAVKTYGGYKVWIFREQPGRLSEVFEL
jgi:hypothetical protein